MIPLVVNVEDREAGTTAQFAFLRSPVRIGRGELNDVPLPQPFVSTYHGLIQFDDREARYLDVGSTNGSVLGGVRLEKNTPALLVPGAELLIGSLRLTFARRATAEHLAPSRAMTAFGLRAASLLREVEEAPPGPPSPGDQPISRVVDPSAGSAAAAAPGAPSPAQSLPELAPGVPEPCALEGGEGAGALRLVRAFVESYLGERSSSQTEVGAFLERVAVVLETFARAFLELRRGYEEFGSEMGIRTLGGDGAIRKARDTAQLLAYVLDPDAQGRERELQRAFADFMLHQVALLRGVVEGAHALLDHIGPESVAAQAPRGIWPMRSAALWKAFETAFHEIADEDDALSAILFGKGFARAYAAIAGERAPTAQDVEGEAKPGSGNRERP